MCLPSSMRDDLLCLPVIEHCPECVMAQPYHRKHWLSFIVAACPHPSTFAARPMSGMRKKTPLVLREVALRIDAVKRFVYNELLRRRRMRLARRGWKARSSTCTGTSTLRSRTSGVGSRYLVSADTGCLYFDRPARFVTMPSHHRA